MPWRGVTGVSERRNWTETNNYLRQFSQIVEPSSSISAKSSRERFCVVLLLT